jgi:hypothetical protein
MQSLENQIRLKFEDWGRNSKDNIRAYFRNVKREDGLTGYDTASVDRKCRLLCQQGYLVPVDKDWERLSDNHNKFVWGYKKTPGKPVKEKKIKIPAEPQQMSRLF